MSSTIDILPKDNAAEQHRQCEAYISTHVKGCRLGDTKVAFLPASAIANLASLPNISSFCVQDPAFAAIHFPTHSCEFFAERVRKEARRCFIGTVYQELSMEFLKQLMKVNCDNHLPIDKRNNIDEDFKGDLKSFMETQDMVCAPVLVLGEYE